MNKKITLYKILMQILNLFDYRFALAKWTSFVLFLWSWMSLRVNAEATRAWYHNNWCGETPVGECLYWVGSVEDYMFLTSSAFHDGFTLYHVGLITAIVLFIITILNELLSELKGSS
mgnify:CR=1 FL=1|jgi:hypothetical protein|tara:strand:+ start:41 stop:391 length:351 start_codon:yes stop_codon:yes gene_type:complete